MWPWWQRRRRQRWQALPPDPQWLGLLERNMRPWQALDAQARQCVLDLVQVFIREKHWEFCGGLRDDDAIRLTVAAHACLLLINLDHDHYRNVSTLLIYPTQYTADEEEEEDESGLVLPAAAEVREGEAHWDGQIVLAWECVRYDAHHLHKGRNVVYHEFAHALDMAQGMVNGTPLLDEAALAARWPRVMTEAYQSLCKAAERGQATLLDPYGCEDPGEFFAVSVECFFCRGASMRQAHRPLYDLLRDYFHQDPASWSGQNR